MSNMSLLLDKCNVDAEHENEVLIVDKDNSEIVTERSHRVDDLLMCSN